MYSPLSPASTASLSVHMRLREKNVLHIMCDWAGSGMTDRIFPDLTQSVVRSGTISSEVRLFRGPVESSVIKPSFKSGKSIDARETL